MTKIKKVLSVALGFLFFCSASLFAAVKDDPIMIKGIRPMGMGGAFTAVADDENAFFYNPAGIAQRTGSLLQIFNFNAAVNQNTVDLVSDLSDVLSNLNSDGDDSQKVDDLITIKDSLSNRDIDFNVSVFNPAFISSPISAGGKGNTVSFGLGFFNNINVGIRAGMIVPRFGLDILRLAVENVSDEREYVSAIPDGLLEMADILQPGTTPAQVRDAIQAGDSWATISSNYLTANFTNLIDNISNIATNPAFIGDGDKYAQIVEQLHNFVNGLSGYAGAHDSYWSMDDTSLKATVNAYATATLDAPFAYKIKSLEALNMPGELSLGMNLKYIQRAKFTQTVRIGNSEIAELLNGSSIEDVIDMKAGASSGQGYGLDLGAMYSLTPRWHFGLQVSDVFTRINYDTGHSFSKRLYPDSAFEHEAYIATQFSVGASHIPQSILGWNTKNRLLLAADIRDIFGSYQNSFKNKLHVGAEYRLGCLALRTGLNKLRPAAGVGLEFNSFQLSYAYYGEESYLAKMLGEPDKTVYYHEFLLAFKVGHNKGRKVSQDKETSKKENKITSADENTVPPEENQAMPAGESEKASEENNNNGE
ncbi:MAG: hypothetical protein FWG57_03830 [Endomicrobia bacterium]|nr:hypothetical protein [Endomicrobiia bacterium]